MLAGERQFRKYDTSYIRPKRSAAPIVFTVILAIVCARWFGLRSFYLFNSCSSSSVELLAEGEEATVVVEEGAGARAISASVLSRRDSFPLRLSSRSAVNELGVDGGLKPGTYTFSGGTSLDDIIRTLQAGPAAGHTLTVPEGFTPRPDRFQRCRSNRGPHHGGGVPDRRFRCERLCRGLCVSGRCGTEQPRRLPVPENLRGR